MYYFVKIDRAYLNQELVLIDDKRVLSGKSGCVCIGCGNPLIARKGTINAWHFAHDMSNTNLETLSLSCGYIKSLKQDKDKILERPIKFNAPRNLNYDIKNKLPVSKRDLELEALINEAWVKYDKKKESPILPMECVRCSFQFASQIRSCPKCGDHLLTRYLCDVNHSDFFT